MWDVYNDMSPLLVILKAPQIGATVMMIIKTFWAAKKKNWDIIYTLPTQSDVNDMSGGKINRFIAQNPILAEWVKDYDTVGQKSVGESIIYYRGTFTQKQGMMHSSDLNVHDEVDASKPEVIVQYDTRLMFKPLDEQRRWYFSHPSFHGKGVAIHWEDSDKKEWFIQCVHCSKEQYLTFPENIDFENECYKCKHCGKELSDLNRKMGIWKPAAQGQFSGYHISQMMCPWISAKKIIKDYKTKDRMYFYNYVLGLPYLSPDDQVSEETILQNCVPDINDQKERVIIGLDTGHNLHYVLANRDGFFGYGYAMSVAENQQLPNPVQNYDPYNSIEKLMSRFKNSIVVADQGGDLIGIRKLQAKYPGRVFLTYYRPDRKTKEIVRWGEKREFGTVIVDRNRAIELLVEELKEKRIAFNGTKEAWKEYAEHWTNIYRVKEEDKKNPDDPVYNWRYVWKRSGADHWVHATLYARVGLDKFGRDKGGFIDDGTPRFGPRGLEIGTATFNDLNSADNANSGFV